MHTYYNTSWLLLRLLVGGNKTAVHLYEYMSVALFKKTFRPKYCSKLIQFLPARQKHMPKRTKKVSASFQAECI